MRALFAGIGGSVVNSVCGCERNTVALPESTRRGYDLSSMRYDRDTAFLPDFLPQRVSKRGIIEPYRESDGKGGTFGNAPINPIIANSIPDIIVPPETDAGTVPALTWDFTMSHIKLQPGGWTSQTTIR